MDDPLLVPPVVPAVAPAVVPLLVRRRPVCRNVPAGDLRAVFDELRAHGARVQTGWALPADPWDLADSGIVCVGSLEDSGDLVAVIGALRRGVDVAVPLDGVPPAVRRDVRRLADVVERPTARAQVPLSDDQREILRLLADGASLPEVAATLFLSLRTAERRLSAAKRSLGVRTTAEALVAMAARS